MKKKISRLVFSRISAVMTAGIMSFSALGGLSVNAGYESEIEELERRQEILAAQREEVEASLREYESNAAEHDLYMQKYDEKMKLQEEEIMNIKQQIAIIEDDIDKLKIQIAEKKKEVDKGVEDFKQRLRIMYMNGNDSMASMLVGSADFYDILARTELVERVSRHDKEMIDGLSEKITELNADMDTLEQNKADAEHKRDIAQGVLKELQKTYAEHEETKQWYENQAEMDRQRTAEMDSQDAQIEEELQEYIRQRQEELDRQRREEEERRRKEEEERRRKEEEERRRREEEEERQRQEDERRRREEEERQRQEEDSYSYNEETTSYSYSYDSYDDDEDEDDYSSSSGSTDFIWPCPTVYNMTDGYGSRYIEESGSNEFHKGIDITKPGCAGEKIVAAASGTVITASNTGNGYGIHVVIDHGGKISTLYGHMSEAAVSVGDYVSQGQTIGYIGCTGYAYGNHCHFEVRVNGQHTDPLNYVSM